MNVKLVKQKDHCREEGQEQQQNENQVRNAVQDWVKEFKTRKAKPARIVFRQTPAES
jgi:hypothetical protein